LISTLVTRLENSLSKAGYATVLDPAIPGVTARLYGILRQPRGAVFSKFYNHYLILDWENDLFGQLERLLQARKFFSKYVNKKYKVPRAWRLTLPNLALIVVSERGFDPETIQVALNQYFVPAMNGECGQIMLLDLSSGTLTCHHESIYKQTASIPLEDAARELGELFLHQYPGGRLVRTSQAES